MDARTWEDIVPFNMGTPEIIIILVVILLVFGVGKLPEIAGAAGKGVREFRRAQREIEEEIGAPIKSLHPKTFLTGLEPAPGRPAAPPATTAADGAPMAAQPAAAETAGSAAATESAPAAPAPAAAAPADADKPPPPAASQVVGSPPPPRLAP